MGSLIFLLLLGYVIAELAASDTYIDTGVFKKSADRIPEFSDGNHPIPYRFRFLKDRNKLSTSLIVSIHAPYPSISVLQRADHIADEAVKLAHNQYGIYVKIVRMEQLINAYLWEYALKGKFPEQDLGVPRISALANKQVRCSALEEQKKTYLKQLRALTDYS